MHPHWLAGFRRHFQEHFGKPFDVQRFRAADGGPVLEIVTYDQRYKQFRVFASLGLAHYAPDIKELAEVIVVADAGWREIPGILANTLFYLARERVPLDSRCAVGIASLYPDFAERYDKSALYFTTADGFDEGFEDVDCGDTTGRVCQALFITTAEQDFHSRHGADAFEAQLRAQDADLCSVRRPACV